MSKMALSCLASNHLGYSFPRKQKHNGSLPLSSSLLHAKISLFYLMGRCHPRKRGPGSLTRALDIKVADTPIVENGQFQGAVEVPVNCYQILGIPIGSSKDQVVKAAMQLRATEIEEGYSPSVLPSRQELLIDIRDKLLFEPEFAGDVKEHVPPKPSLILPWQWLPAAMSLLQEVGEEKIVMDIGRAVRQQPNAKPYIHDFLLSMALAECSIARRGFERGTVSEGFEALARAQLLLRSKRSLAKLILLAEIEASLEELAPICLLENLSKPRTPENVERREGALTALRELLRQGLEGEVSCAVRDWSEFLSQALKKLLAIEVVGLLPWETIALIRKNNNSSEAQQQRFVIDCNCFYIALLAHIALGFSNKRPELIEKAKKITESLEKTDAVNLGFERIICKTLLGEGKLALTEDLQKLGLNGNSLNQHFVQDVSRQADKGNAEFYSSLEKWLKDAALGLFVDTRDCTPSLVNYFGGNMKMSVNGLKKKGFEHPQIGARHTSSSYAASSQAQSLMPTNPVQAFTFSSSAEIPEAGPDQISPSKVPSHSIFSKSKNASSFKWKQNVGVPRKKLSGSLSGKSKIAGKFFLAAVLAGSVFTTYKLHVQSRPITRLFESHTAQPDCTMRTSMDAVNQRPSCSTRNAHSLSGNIGRRITMAIARSLIPFTQQSQNHNEQNAWPVNDLSLLIRKSGNNAFRRKQMEFREAESLVRRWQSIKAEALGPNHEIHRLSEILAEPMLSQWQALAESAKSSSCFWRFVLLHSSIVHAEISSDDIGWEIAEVDAVLEEAAELVDESQLKNPNYYSTYHIRYVLKRGSDRRWKFCGAGIQSPV